MTEFVVLSAIFLVCTLNLFFTLYILAETRMYNMIVKYKCGSCGTETMIEGVDKIKKWGCPVCSAGEKNQELKENDGSKKKIILKG